MHFCSFNGRQVKLLVEKCWSSTSYFCSNSIVYYSPNTSGSLSRCLYINKPKENVSISSDKYKRLVLMTDHYYSTSNEKPPDDGVNKVSSKDKLKRAVKDYGVTVIVFHVAISLMSLGISYLVISSGVDVAGLMAWMGVEATNNIAAGAGTFVVAYAVHKVFAPVRISITLASTPFIVRYLRRIKVLKPPKPTA